MKAQKLFTAQNLNTWYFSYKIFGIAETLSIRVTIIKMKRGQFQVNLYFP